MGITYTRLFHLMLDLGIKKRGITEKSQHNRLYNGKTCKK